MVWRDPRAQSGRARGRTLSPGVLVMRPRRRLTSSRRYHTIATVSQRRSAEWVALSVGPEGFTMGMATATQTKPVVASKATRRTGALTITKLRPLGDRVVVQPSAREEMT